MKINLINNSISIAVDAKIYNLDMIHKCFYWYTDNYIVEIDEKKDKIVVTLSPKEETKIEENQFSTISKKIKNDIVDFKTRDVITKETKTIRELLIAKAFYPIEEGMEKPPGEISDPVGFDIDD